MCVRAVVFDVDGVIIPLRSSWGYLHRYFGVESEAAANYELFKQGRISYYEWLYLDTSMWIKRRGRLHKRELEKALKAVKPRREAYHVIASLKRMGVKTALLSAGIDLLVRRLAEELGTDFWMANVLEFDENGFLIPGGRPCVPGGRKDVVLPIVEEALKVSRDEMAYVGDSEWDVKVMKLVRLPIAMGGDEHVARVASYVITDLREVVAIVSRYNSLCDRKADK